MLAGSVEFPTRGEHLDNLQMIAQVMAELSGIPEKGGKIVEQLQLIVELMLEGFDAQCFEPFEHEIVDCAEQGEVGHEKEDAHEQDPMSAISKKGTWSRGNHIKYFVPSPVYRFTSGVNHWL